MTKVCVLELRGCLASSAAITYDVMATANRLGATTQRALPFTVATIRCGTRRNSATLAEAELVIVPGLGTATADALEQQLDGPACRRAIALLRSALESGATLAASCASTFLLAQAGLLDGRRATTTWWLAPLFQRRYPAVELLTQHLVVSDGPVVTAGAAMAQMDLMLALVARFAGTGLAKACANYLLLDERRSQVPYMAFAYLAAQDAHIAKADKWIRTNLSRNFGVDELAAAVTLAPRTFARRVAATCGVSPIQWVQRIRVETARDLLASTRLSVEEIARRVGYAEPSTLRRLIRRDTRQAPGYFRPMP